jgi:protein arginine kinase
MRLAVRGLYGEGTEATGDFFQVSNQTTLGKSEEQIVAEFLEHAIPQFIEYERHARKGLMKHKGIAVEDKIQRSLSLLRAARLINSEETMYLLSLVRLAINLDLVHDVDMKTVNELFLQTQPAHLQRIVGREMSDQERAEARARFIRQRLCGN